MNSCTVSPDWPIISACPEASVSKFIYHKFSFSFNKMFFAQKHTEWFNNKVEKNISLECAISFQCGSFVINRKSHTGDSSILPYFFFQGTSVPTEFSEFVQKR